MKEKFSPPPEQVKLTEQTYPQNPDRIQQLGILFRALSHRVKKFITNNENNLFHPPEVSSIHPVRRVFDIMSHQPESQASNEYNESIRPRKEDSEK